MDKRGMTLLEFVIDLIIGVICAILLLLAFSVIYNVFFGGKEKIEAAQTLEALKEKAEKLDYGKISDFLLMVPKDWYLLSFDKGINSESTNEEVMVLCAEKSCLCVCKPKKIIWFIPNGVDCIKNAQCIITTKPFKISEKDLYLKIPQSKGIKINNTGELFQIIVNR